MGRKYKKEADGSWISPVKRGYHMMCCDCGLVHVLNFRHIPCGSGRKIQFQAFRDNRATAAARKKKQKKQ